MALSGYYLGCPSWGMKTWVGKLFPQGTKQTDFLSSYARIFNTVEGNTTFYAMPSIANVARWDEQTPPEFRFCFKFPKKITHEKLLKDVDDYAAAFVERLAPLGDKLGTLTLQLPPRFGPKQLDRLGAFLGALPRTSRYAVELRNEVFFAGGPEERAATTLLAQLGVDSVMMDTRGLHAGSDPALAEVRQQKPNLPVVMRVTGPQPIVRFVPHEDFEAGRSFVDPWIERFSGWIAAGMKPYFFMHAPDDTFAPENAYRFHQLLSRVAPVGELPAWPGEPIQTQLSIARDAPSV